MGLLIKGFVSINSCYYKSGIYLGFPDAAGRSEAASFNIYVRLLNSYMVFSVGLVSDTIRASKLIIAPIFYFLKYLTLAAPLRFAASGAFGARGAPLIHTQLKIDRC